jgi:hypothetical protein
MIGVFFIGIENPFVEYLGPLSQCYTSCVQRNYSFDHSTARSHSSRHTADLLVEAIGSGADST